MSEQEAEGKGNKSGIEVGVPLIARAGKELIPLSQLIQVLEVANSTNYELENL